MNVRDLKQNLRDHGAIFLKSSEVIDLPEQVEIDDEELVGDNTLKKMLYERQLCGQFNSNKLDSLKEIMESTTNRIIIFYNFTKEKDLIVGLCEKLKKPYSIINGEIKDLEAYTTKDDSITIVQYQAFKLQYVRLRSFLEYNQRKEYIELVKLTLASIIIY